MIQDHQTKISPRFANILDNLKPSVKVRAILILNVFPDQPTSLRRKPFQERKETAASAQQLAQSVLVDIDAILRRFQGKRLADDADALGSVPVETTPAGIAALGASEHVRAILEDQPISLP